MFYLTSWWTDTGCFNGIGLQSVSLPVMANKYELCWYWNVCKSHHCMEVFCHVSFLIWKHTIIYYFHTIFGTPFGICSGEYCWGAVTLTNWSPPLHVQANWASPSGAAGTVWTPYHTAGPVDALEQHIEQSVSPGLWHLTNPSSSLEYMGIYVLCFVYF